MPISKQTRNLLAYIIGTVVVLFGTVLLVAFANGWQYDFATGEIRETGLIIMNSEPSGATITVDGKPVKSRTPYRYQNLLPGTYEVAYTRDGYRPWVKQTNVVAEEVTFNDYAWLLPKEVPVRQRYSDRTITGSTQSADRRRTVLVETPPSPTGGLPIPPRLLTTTDWSRGPASLYAPTATALNATTPNPTQIASFDNLQLSVDGNSLLVRQTSLNGTTQYLVMPASPSDNPRIVNLTALVPTPIDWLEWGPSGNNELWFSTQGRVVRFFVGDQRQEEIIASDVVAANWSQDKLITVETQADATRALVVRDNGGLSAPEKIGAVPVSKTYATEYFRWLDHDYIGVLPDTNDLWLTRDVFTNKSARVTSLVGKNVTSFTVNRSGRYIAFNQNNRFVSLDIERNQRARFQADLTGLTHWEWMNDQHLVIEAGGELRLIDFDGQNNELIASLVASGSPLIFADNKSLLTFASRDGKLLLSHYFLNPEKIIE